MACQFSNAATLVSAGSISSDGEGFTYHLLGGAASADNGSRIAGSARVLSVSAGLARAHEKCLPSRWTENFLLLSHSTHLWRSVLSVVRLRQNQASDLSRCVVYVACLSGVGGAG